MDTSEKPLRFRGSSRRDLLAFPAEARREAGFQLSFVQFGDDPVDWKPMPVIGSGVREIRIRDDGGAFRVIYVAKFRDAIYVLHCFEKKTQTTAQRDIAIAAARYKELEKEMQA